MQRERTHVAHHRGSVRAGLLAVLRFRRAVSLEPLPTSVSLAVRRQCQRQDSTYLLARGPLTTGALLLRSHALLSVRAVGPARGGLLVRLFAATVRLVDPDMASELVRAREALVTPARESGRGARVSEGPRSEHRACCSRKPSEAIHRRTDNKDLQRGTQGVGPDERQRAR